MVFADSSGFIAAFDSRDAAHPEGARCWREIAEAGEPILTTSLVFAETVTFLRRRAGWEASRRVGEAILRSRVIEMVHPTADQIEAAWRELLRVADPKLSLCDTLSFVVMRERGVLRALTLDRHFAEAGFSSLPA